MSRSAHHRLGSPARLGDAPARARLMPNIVPNAPPMPAPASDAPAIFRSANVAWS
jgi:hypothetical protein